MKKKNNKTDNGLDFEVDFSNLDDLFSDSEFGASFGNGFGTGFGAGFNSGFNSGLNTGFGRNFGTGTSGCSFNRGFGPYAGFDNPFYGKFNPTPNESNENKEKTKPNWHILSTLILIGLVIYKLRELKK